MIAGGRRWATDAALRAAGVVALVVAWWSIHWLFGALDLGRPHQPGVLELAAAAAGFLCFSAGTALVLLGGHLADPIEVSRRWARRRPDR